jgi:hypothetical protein
VTRSSACCGPETQACTARDVSRNRQTTETNRMLSTPGLTPGPPILVQRFAVDWDDLEKGTGDRVLEIGGRHSTGCFYLNPRYTVSCPEPSPEFFHRARKCQAAWCRTMGQVLGSSNRRRAASRARAIERQLAFTGILIIDGNHIDPREWQPLGFTLDPPGMGKLPSR